MDGETEDAERVIQQAMDQARDEALDEAAKECDLLDDDGGRIAALALAKRIRALKKGAK
jgi:hypothetical protein